MRARLAQDNESGRRPRQRARPMAQGDLTSMSSTNRSPARTGIAERTDKAGRTQYRGTAYDKRAGKHLRGPWTYALAEARSWRVDALARLASGELSADRGITVREAVDRFLAGIEDGSIRNRSGATFKPSAVRGYRRELRGRVVTAFGPTRLAELTLPDVQRWADTLVGEGLAPSTVRNVVTALRSLYGWAMPRGLARVNPTVGVRLPTGGKVRDRIAAPSEARTLIAALDPRDQAALGLALYAGLRLGEVVALDWRHIDLEARTLRVERAWDAPAQTYVEPKSKAGRRTVPIMDRLAVLLADHAVLMDHPGEGLLFPGRDGERPVRPTNLTDRLARRWNAAGVAGIGMHEARHTAASLFIAAGLNAKTVSTYLGHADIATTFDRYGHLFPGAEHEARGLLDAYMERHDA